MMTTSTDATTFTATDPRSGAATGASYRDATPTEVLGAVDGAVAAFPALRALSAAQRSTLLRTIASAIEGLGHELVDVADSETGLGTDRLEDERARTCAQLRSFADLVDEGSYVEAIIDHADPDGTPPRPDLRRMLIAVGPVAVFGASNFPLAFSVPGGDTASALAAGCPVVVKAHPAHPATSDLCAGAISGALAKLGLPQGVFALLHGDGHGVGEALVTAPGVRAVGFTGSLTGGRALFDLAAARPEPIPVYAEMGSLNPIFVTAAALAVRGGTIAEGFVASMNLGTGQFCTKPGVVVLPPGASTDGFVADVARAVSARSADVMLAPRLKNGLSHRLAETVGVDRVEVIARGQTDETGVRHPAVVLTVDADRFLETPQLREEHFGPVSILVRCGSSDEQREVARRLPGSLTATVHSEAEDRGSIADLVAILRERAGRLVFDGFPTGVAVTHAMHHGGPYPATTAPAHTSVGSSAIRRFLRPVSYQDAPDGFLPAALQDGNPLGIRRLVDGVPTSD
ncbi:MAG: aldehyde dehydrogenase (NADP(+)) [Actinobacteria bacterium]|nr:aldehyde dehydrogenase (NADP(+)) [Actinomycetota bacterium]